MLPRFDGTAAPGAGGQLIRGADAASEELIATSLLDRFNGIIGTVGGGAASDPQTNAKRRFAPAVVAMFESLAANRLTGTNQRRGPLELLNRKQAQRVAHQHGHAFITRPSRYGSLQAPQTHRVRREAQVGFGLAAACGKEEQVGQGFGTDATFRVIEFADTCHVQQDECDLEWTPGSVGRLVNVLVEIGLLTPANFLRVDGMSTLEPHRPIHELESLERLRVLRQQRQPLFDSLQRVSAIV